MESEGLLLVLGLVVEGALALGLGLDGALALALELAFLCLQVEDIEKPSEEGLV